MLLNSNSLTYSKVRDFVSLGGFSSTLTGIGFMRPHLESLESLESFLHAIYINLYIILLTVNTSTLHLSM